eukprot:CAMPEP_0172536614 /NCGR_PEP_ID=MMETSP1067-20121228/8353_1 /TAXON_ID=265564 ORGANISM="Thalassiosira punctigera, Strain Tpunct2005C2" /NCGR_SAMPLE_ID=MMETSP1067 /ASSEMBLY_ACC=CAM_ASM_000444 /LENGTH=608 /DNA_ID=CAMNT_0013321721 /DNA_START=50 /DNA_END=1876 /DNA_ORIENTATION=-
MMAKQWFFYQRHQVALLVLVLSSLGNTFSVAFRLQSTTTSSSSVGSRSIFYANNPITSPATTRIRHRSNGIVNGGGSARLQCSLLPSAVADVASKISPPIRNSLLLGSAAALAYKNRRKLFYPGSSPDPALSEPLPDGSLGCPLVGNLSVFTQMGDVKSGAGKFYRVQAARSDNPTIFKYAILGKPTVLVSGMKNVRAVFNQEFRLVKTGLVSKGFKKLFGGESLLLATDQGRHQFLRRLVGQSMTPDAIDDAMPALVESATTQINRLSLDKPVEMEDVLTQFTLDVAWRQILGLDLKNDEIQTFNGAVGDWIGGILNIFTTLLPGTRWTKAGKAYSYLVSKIERKLDDLEKNGPDGSTLSGMYFAKDEEDPSKSLTREEIISNSLLLILAGSETAASTLTVAMLVLGLHKDVLKKLKEEQLAMMSKYEGKEMTRDMLEKECPYLDAVIKETMRIKPLATTGAMRFAQESFVVEGKQIPKGYAVGFNVYITHSLDEKVKEEGDAHMNVVTGFKPERWLDAETRPTEYMPFGLGPRYCLGVNLALAEMKVFLALFARRVDFEMTNTTAENVEWKKLSIIPKPRDGAFISITSLTDGTAGSRVVESAVSA